MVVDIIYKLIFPAFRQCAYWVNILFKAVGGWGVYLAAFLLVCIVCLFLTPLRGAAVGSIQVFTVSKIHNKSSKKAGGG